MKDGREASQWLHCPPYLTFFQVKGGGGSGRRVTWGEALRAQEAGLIPISWRGANVHAIYCMTASHISINPRHKAGNRKGRAEGAEGECWCVERNKEKWENKKLGERCNREKRSEILLKLHMQKPEMDARTTEPVQII